MKVKHIKLLSLQEEAEIFSAHFNHGISKREIKIKYKITDFQFSQLVRRIIEKENSTKYPCMKIKWVGRINGGWTEVK